ncbi:hypothetical protein BLNAU_21866 [Blattamonas nauphoetae]|uniref:Uncharacterized protein n=1 Tax=Blattamonas nauphoetae TaxID=2049346 RepID=A0ABQ9WZ03_9EUKA|nr:hypothetical protein BLNAU_21866 [Blattamonas nauphoetae]
MGAFISKISSSAVSPSQDCSPFLNWKEEALPSQSEAAVVFRSLVATIKLQPVFNDSLEAKAVNFLRTLASTSGASWTDLMQSIVVLVSSASPVVTKAGMKLLDFLLATSSESTRLSLIKAGIFRQLIVTLKPQSLSFTEAADIHTGIVQSISCSLWLETPDAPEGDEIEDDDDDRQSDLEAIFQQVLMPSEEYIRRLCENRYSIVVGDQSRQFMALLFRILFLCPCYPPAMDFVLHMPVFLTIPSCLTFFESDESIWLSLYLMDSSNEEWSKKGGAGQYVWQFVHRMLRMEGFEDVIEEQLRNNNLSHFGRAYVAKSVVRNIVQGVNLPKYE